MRRVGRSTYRLFYLLPAPALFAFGVTVGQRWFAGEAVVFAFFITTAWLYVGRWIALWLVALCVSTLTCPNCQEELDAIDVWNCACGYHDHRERHILAGHCPKCGAIASHVNCPRCDATILLW